MNKIVKGLVFGLLALFVTSSYAYSARVGVVNIQEVYSKASQYKALEKKLEGEFKTRKTKLLDKRKGLETGIAKFRRDQEVLSQKDKLSEQRKLSKEEIEYKRLAKELDVDIQLRQREELEKLQKVLQSTFAKVAKKKKLDLVLASQAILYSVSKVDVTKEVLKELK